MNFINAKITADGYVDAADFKINLPAGHGAAKLAGQAVTLGIRPEEIFDVNIPSNVTPSPENTVKAFIDVMEPLGHEYVSDLKIGSTSVVATIDKETKIRAGTEANVCINLDRIHIFHAETEERVK